MTHPASEQKEVLIALLPKRSALDILKTEGWYHIPVEHAPSRWPPKVMAFYQGKVFGGEQYQIRYFGEVAEIRIVARKELFPHDSDSEDKTDNLYYRVQLKHVAERHIPIMSLRPRRLVFVPTTWKKFEFAEQINDLFDGSPLEDMLWGALKHSQISAERQWRILVRGRKYYIDFAIFCNQGKLAVETDGYTFHYDSRNQIDYNTWRQNAIQIDNWRFLHYTAQQINDEKVPYLSQIQTVIDQLGGVESLGKFSRKIGEEQGSYIIDGEEPL